MSRAAAANRHSQRDTGRFASQATLRAQQRALLAPASRWRKEWVKPSTLSGSSSYKVLKWVKFDEGGELAEDGEQPTEEQVTAAISGARKLLQPPSAADTPVTGTPSASMATTPAPSGLGPPGVRSALRSEISISESVSATASPGGELDAQVSLARQPDLEAGQGPAAAGGHVPAGSQEPQGMELDTEPGKEDTGTDVQVEVEQREHDTRIAPELIGAEAADSRAALGIGDPIEGGPPEITG